MQRNKPSKLVTALKGRYWRTRQWLTNKLGLKPADYVLEGIRLPADPELISGVVDLALRRGSYEHEERENLPGMLKQGDVVLELGAGLGLVSTLCAQDKRVSRVVTVEANPALIPYVRNVHEINNVKSRARVIRAIAIPEPEVDAMDFFVRRDVWASSTNGTVWGWAKKVQTRVINLNALVEEIEPTVFIIDIEGGEDQLFDGFKPGTLRQIYLELHKRVIGAKGIGLIFDQLSKLGFVYDPRFSSGGVVSFSRPEAEDKKAR